MKKKVVCIYEEWVSVYWWRRIQDKIFGRPPDPQLDHIYTVVKEKNGYYTLEEFAKYREFRVEGFRPVIGTYDESFEKIVELKPETAN